MRTGIEGKGVARTYAWSVSLGLAGWVAGVFGIQWLAGVLT